MMEVLEEGAEKLGLTLTPAQIQQFEVYYRELVDWNQRVNLTSVTDYDEVQVKHFLDSLTIIPILADLLSCRFTALLEASLGVIDVGAGAGLPGLALRLAMPNTHLVLIESVGKKVSFLRHLVETLHLDQVEVRVGRAEELAHDPNLRQSADLCLARAVAALPALIELTLPFVRIGGLFMAYKGPHIDDEVKTSSNAIRVLGGRLRDVREIRLGSNLSPRNIVIIEKVASTPQTYPRKPGIPSKRPL